MELIENKDIKITWYPGAPGDTDTPLVLLALTDYLEDGSPVEVLTSQLRDAPDEIRATSGRTFARGNERTRLSWTTVRRVGDLDPSHAMEDTLVVAAGLPAAVGWVRIELTRRDDDWQIPDVVITEAGGAPRLRNGYLHIEWTIEGGALDLYDPGATPPTIYPDGELLLSSATVTDRDALLLMRAS